MLEEEVKLLRQELGYALEMLHKLSGRVAEYDAAALVGRFPQQRLPSA